MKKPIRNEKDLALRLSAYAASAGALALVGSSASAQVVHSGLQDIELGMPSDLLEIDLDGDLVNDFGFNIYGFSYYGTYGSYFYSTYLGFGLILNPKTDGYDNSWIGKTGTFVYSLSSVSGSTFYSTYIPIVAGLDAGDPIDASETLWLNSPALSMSGIMSYFFNMSYYSGSTSWAYLYIGFGDMAGRTSFIGVRFWIGTEQHYGWIRVQLGDYIDPLRIIDWAYESTPGVGIYAGDGGDLDGPVLSVYGIGATTPDRTVSLTVSSDEPVAGLDTEDFSIENGSVSGISMISDTEYTVDILADGYGVVNVELMAGTVEDSYGNMNDAAAFVSYEYIDSSVDLETPDQQGIIVYPNPVNGELHVRLENRSGIQLINMKGQVLYGQENVLDHTIDVSGFSPGLYILQVRNDHTVVRHKVIVE